MSFFGRSFSRLNIRLSAGFFDRLGGCLSTACAIHCSLKPLLFFLPSVAWIDVFIDPSFERVLLALGIVLAVGSAVWGYSNHRRVELFLPLTTAVTMILLGRYLGVGRFRTLLVVSGGLTLASTHLLNSKFMDKFYQDGHCSH